MNISYRTYGQFDLDIIIVHDDNFKTKNIVGIENVG